MGDREPCPHRIVGDVGGAYAFGLVGGGIWHSVKGARNAPRNQRWSGSLKAVTVSELSECNSCREQYSFFRGR